MSFEFFNQALIDVEVPSFPPSIVVALPTQTPAPVLIVPGPPGPKGEPGTAGGSVYTHTQTTPSSNWIINHGLGTYPSVVVRVDGERVMTDLQDVSPNTISVIFAEPKTGEVYLKP